MPKLPDFDDALYPLHLERRTDILETLAKQLIEEIGIDPFSFYCVHTGKRLGRLDRETITSLTTIIEYDIDNPDEWDDIKSDILGRCYLIMRPSPAWVSQNIYKLGELMHYNQLDALVYLMFRFWEPLISNERNRAKSQHMWSAWESKANWLNRKITLRHKLESWPIDVVKDIVALLVEADTWLGLHRLAIDPKYDVDNVITGWCDNTSEFIHYLHGKLPKLIENAKRDLKQSQGNSVSRAAMPAFRERPVSQKAIKTKQREGDVNTIMNLFKAWSEPTKHTEQAKEILQTEKPIDSKFVAPKLNPTQKLTFKFRSTK